MGNNSTVNFIFLSRYGETSSKAMATRTSSSFENLKYTDSTINNTIDSQPLNVWHNGF